MIRSNWSKAAVTVVVMAVLAAACSSSDNGSEEDSSAPVETTLPPTSSAPATTSSAVSTTTAAPDEPPTPVKTMLPATTSTPQTTTTPPTTTATETPTTTTITTTETPPTTTTTPETVAEPQWQRVNGTEDCACADGSDYFYWVREGDPDKLVFYLQGGGACFSAASCSFANGNFDPNADESDPFDNPQFWSGIFDFDNPLNPLADHSFVVALYCTGDVHVGNNTQAYSSDLTVSHNGFINASTALQTAADRFGDASEVIVAGTSAGSAAAPLYAGLAADLFPEAEIAVVADASGAYPSVPAVNSAIGALWGAFSVVPDWPVNEGIQPPEWGLPGLFIQAGQHAPRIRFSRYDNAFDNTQVFFASLAGFDASRLDELMALNEERIEEAGVTQSSFTAPGRAHGILPRPSFYDLEVEGNSFLDWITRFLEGEEVDDVTCVDCS